MITTNAPLQYVQIICSDNTGCSFIRLRWNALYLQSFPKTNVIPVVTNIPIMWDQMLYRTKAIVWQRPLDTQMVMNVKAVQPKFGFRMVAEFDDDIWDPVPDYNGLQLNDKENMENLKRNLPCFDTVTVSTDFMKHVMEKAFGISNIVVVENAIPKFMYNLHRGRLGTDLKKPVVLWAGANQHFSNPVVDKDGKIIKPGMEGDWEKEWIDFVVKNVKDDKIDFIMLGGIFPFFLEKIREKVKVLPWVDTNTFPRVYMSINPDFVIAPLAENDFNRCKSNLSYLQACAVGAVFIGSKFEYSPYDNTVTDLKDFWKYTKKDEYNRIVEIQDRFMEETGGYLESAKHINKFLSVLDNSDIIRTI